MDFISKNPEIVLAVLAAVNGILVTYILTPAAKLLWLWLTKRKEAEGKVLDAKLEQFVKDKEEERNSTQRFINSLTLRVETLETQIKETQIIKDKLEETVSSLKTEKRIEAAQIKVAVEKWKAEAALWKEKSEQLEERLCIAEATLMGLKQRFPKWFFVMNEIKDEDMERLDNLFDGFIEDLQKKRREYNG